MDLQDNAKRNIMKGFVSGAFLLIIIIINRIIGHSEKLEASRALGKKWDLSQEKFYTFPAITAYEEKNLKLSYIVFL